MRRLALALSLSLPLALARTAGADPPRAEGRIDSGEGNVEVLGRPVQVGETLELPEGYLCVEEQGTEDEDVGSFTVVPGSFGSPLDSREPGVSAEDPAPRPATPPSCREERAAYLAELWRASGIEVSSPDALLEGLEGKEGGPDAGFYWFALATDPFRPLAWSSALRERADALIRCVRRL